MKKLNGIALMLFGIEVSLPALVMYSRVEVLWEVGVLIAGIGLVVTFCSKE